MASLVTSARRADVSELATKRDLADVKADIAVFKAEVEARISKTETSLIKWVAGLIGFQTLAILGAVVARVRFLHA